MSIGIVFTLLRDTVLLLCHSYDDLDFEIVQQYYLMKSMITMTMTSIEFQ